MNEEKSEGLVEKILSWWTDGSDREGSAVPEESRSSKDSPLIISYMPAGGGLIGLTICPGRKGKSATGTDWDRDLDTDLDDIRKWGAGMVITVLDDGEHDALDDGAFGRKIRSLGMDWVDLPMPASGIPDTETIEILSGASPEIHRVLDSRQNVLVHCMDGFSRSGLIAALLLAERGDTAADVLSRIRDIRPGVLSDPEQEEFVYRRAALDGPRAGRILSCLFGGAIGDALGAEVEFMSLGEIREIFPNGVDRIIEHDGQIGSITDDTQMTLFTAEGLIRAHDSGEDPVREVHKALLRWIVTQGDKAPEDFDNTGLVTDFRLHRARAPGMTCTGSLRAPLAVGEPARNDSMGCGTIMRVAPVALMGGSDIERIAIETSALTHGHPAGQEAAAAWALILAAALDGEDPENAALAQIGRFGDGVSKAIKAAIEADRDGLPETVETLGGGWTADEALSIALYACLCASTFEHGLRIAVTHSGDSDSTGAIAGNLLGLIYPGQVAAHPWRREVECPDLITRIARNIDRCATPDS